MKSHSNRNTINRRDFLKGLAAAGLALGSGSLIGSTRADTSAGMGAPASARLTISPNDILNSIPADYTGLSFETMQLEDPSYFAKENREFVDILKRLSPRGVLRIGGNSSEFCYWKDSPDAGPPAPKTSGIGNPDNWMPQKFHAITPQAIDNLAGFLHATGWTAIYGLNLGTGSPERDSAEAEYVARALGAKLRYFQIGNEPDLYNRPNNGLRPPDWGFSDYLNEWTAIADAVIARVPQAQFAGPDVASDSDWIVQFSQQAPDRLKGHIGILSGHYYASGPPDNPRVTIANLLKPNASIANHMGQIIPAAKSAGLEFRMTEGNSCYRGGKPGMSNAFASALWGADYMLEMASLGGKGINFHSGSGHAIAQSLGGHLPGARNDADLEAAKLGTFYAPVAGSPQAGYYARPLYYGMILAQQFAGTEMVTSNFDPGAVNATAYAARDNHGYRIALFNKDDTNDLAVTIAVDPGSPSLDDAELWRLTGPALDSTSGVMLACASVGPGGAWKVASREHIAPRDGILTIALPHASAALLFVAARSETQ